jgi:hypothetical protein
MKMAVMAVAALVAVACGCHSPAPGTMVLDSQAIKEAQYDEATRVMTLTFPSGSVYAYEGVPADVFQTLTTSPSAGSYYHENIRNRYTVRMLKPAGGK